ncbi:MAG TPA: hypothetical protein VEG38_19105 [Acidimicrobiia bacterium]|nr:hypothetical protein [Acidimicrobiia bacterium]
MPSTVQVYVPTAGLPGPLGGAGFGVGLAGAVGVGARVVAEDARVVAVARAGPDVAVVVLTPAPRFPAVVMVAVVADGGTEPGTPTGGAADVVVVSGAAAVEAVVLLGAPATANSPPRRNEGGPLSRTL